MMGKSSGSLFRWLSILAGVFAVSSLLAAVLLRSLPPSVLALPLVLIFPVKMFLAGYHWTDPDLHPDRKRDLWLFGGIMGFFAMVTLLGIIPAAMILHPHENWGTALGLIIFFGLFPIGYIFGQRKRRRSPVAPEPQDE